MSQIDIIDAYLTNRLDEGARLAFEQQMAADSQLKAEVDIQRSIIEGVKQARIAELKAMLSNVPVGGTSTALVGKVAIATITAGLLGTILYFTLKPETENQTSILPEQPTIEQPISPAEEPKKINTLEQSEAPVTSESKKPEEPQPMPEVRKMDKVKPMSPKVEVMDLTKDVESDSKNTGAPEPTSAPEVSHSAIEVETEMDNKTYPFHYQFKNNKLVLYGPFDASLYEIIEINGGTHTLFLFYKNSYYHLDEKESQVVPLIMIRDLELLRMLEKYRNKK